MLSLPKEPNPEVDTAKPLALRYFCRHLTSSPAMPRDKSLVNEQVEEICPPEIRALIKFWSSIILAVKIETC